MKASYDQRESLRGQKSTVLSKYEQEKGQPCCSFSQRSISLLQEDEYVRFFFKIINSNILKKKKKSIMGYVRFTCRKTDQMVSLRKKNVVRIV